MALLEIAKKIIKEHYEEGCYGIFCTRNLGGDVMSTLYDQDGLRIDISYEYGYFEVFGLSEDEFEKLESFYETQEKK